MPQQPQPRKPPRYQVIADALRAAIKDGTLQPGAKLNSETELMAEYGVARGTVREAFALLRAEGLTEARRGAGVYVRGFRTIRRNATERLASSVWGVGRPIWGVDIDSRPMDTANLRVEEIEPPDRIAACFGLSPDETVWMRDRDYLVEGRAVQRATSYLPSSIVAGSAITQPNSGPGGTYARLAELGRAPAKFREEIQVRMPLADEAARLGLGAGTPVILIARTAFDADNRPVEVNEMLLDASSYLLQYDFSA